MQSDNQSVSIQESIARLELHRNQILGRCYLERRKSDVPPSSQILDQRIRAIEKKEAA